MFTKNKIPLLRSILFHILESITKIFYEYEMNLQFTNYIYYLQTNKNCITFSSNFFFFYYVTHLKERIRIIKTLPFISFSPQNYNTFIKKKNPGVSLQISKK